MRHYSCLFFTVHLYFSVIESKLVIFNRELNVVRTEKVFCHVTTLKILRQKNAIAFKFRLASLCG